MTKKILLIDDSKTQLFGLKLILEKNGFSTITAKNAIEGIELAFNEMPSLIISDILMPSINGYQLCRLLKNDPITTNIPIILLTILDSKIDKFWGLKAGADKFLNKESSPEELISQIKPIFDSAPIFEKPNNTPNLIFSEKIYQEKINQILDETLIKSTITTEFHKLSENIYNEEKLTNEIFSMLSSLLDFEVASLFFEDADPKKEKEIIFNKKMQENTQKHLANNFFKAIFETEKNFKIKTLNETIQSAENFYEFIIPIKSNNQIIGGLGLYSKEEINYKIQKTFNIILDELRLLMQIKFLNAKTKLLTIIDPLTNLYNRRHYQDILEREFSRAKRYKSPLSVAMFDIDNFKKINDNYGHQAGDIILQEVSKIIISSIRNTDFAFRYGGEEILVLLTNSKIEDAIIPIERIRKKIEDLKLKINNETINITISAGISADKDASSDDALTKNADDALYHSKTTGKNKVSVWNEEFSAN